MSIEPGPQIWQSEGKIILGWRFGGGVYCLDCAREKGLGDDAGLSANSPFAPVVQEDQPHPLVLRITPCSGDCGMDLAKPA